MCGNEKKEGSRFPNALPILELKSQGVLNELGSK
jgi:hypothetical protein